jgi:hypothetical protein
VKMFFVVKNGEVGALIALHDAREKGFAPPHRGFAPAHRCSRRP